MKTHDKATVEDFQPHKIYATAVGSRGVLEKLGVKIHGKPALANVIIGSEEYATSVLLFSWATTSQKILFEKCAPDSEYECRIGDTLYPLLGLTESKVEVVILGSPEPRIEHDIKKQTLLDPITEHARLVGIILGIPKIYLHIGALYFHEVLPDKEGELRIFLGMTPASTANPEYPHEIAGIDVTVPVDRCFPLSKPLFGRGVVLGDGKLDLVQVVGNNYYFLFNPLFLEQNQEGGIAVFSKMLCIALNYWCKEDKSGTSIDTAYTPLDTEQIPLLVETYRNSSDEVYKNRIHKIVVEVASLEKELRTKRRLLAQSQRIREHIHETNVVGKTISENLINDFPKLLAHPLVRQARIIPGVGIEVRTNDVTMSHEGVRYRLGRYVISISIFEDIVIWTEHAEHPRGVPHPHINAYVGHCFGNLGESIDDAISEHRYGDAFTFILDWLSDGYAPELIIYERIEEWPRVNDSRTKGALT